MHKMYVIAASGVGALAGHYRVCNRIDMMARRVAYRRHIVGVGRRPLQVPTREEPMHIPDQS